MRFSQHILIVMTVKMSGITKCTCHRNWLNCSQTVNHKEQGTRQRIKSKFFFLHESPKEELDTQRISATMFDTSLYCSVAMERLFS